MWFVPAAVVAIVALFAVAAMVSPFFADQVIWKYYWGPIAADGCSAVPTSDICDLSVPGLGLEALSRNGVVAHAGYNPVNTGTWAVLLGACILFLAQILNKFRTQMGIRLVLGATAWVVAGSIFHVLEDTGLVKAPFEYLFITPPIYLLFAALGIVSFVLGQYLKRVAEKVGTARALAKLWLILLVPVMVYLILWSRDWPGLAAYVNPGLVALFAAIAFGLAAWRTHRVGRIDPTGLVLDLSVGWILFAVAYTVQFLRAPWTTHSGGMPMAIVLAPALALLGVVLVARLPARVTAIVSIGLAAIFVPFTLLWLASAIYSKLAGGTFPLDTRSPTVLAAVYGLGAVLMVVAGARFWKRRLDGNWDTVRTALRQPINLLIVFAQLLDGFATALGIDLNGYVEKHVLSGGIITRFGDVAMQAHLTAAATHKTFLGFVPVKLLVSLALIYIMDVAPQSVPVDARPKQSQTMIGLVKFAVIMVGLGPGIRDFLRLSLGI